MAKAVGEVPEEHEQAQLEMLKAVDSRRARGRVLHSAKEDALDQLWPARSQTQKFWLQQAERHGFDDAPAHLEGNGA